MMELELHLTSTCYLSNCISGSDLYY